MNATHATAPGLGRASGFPAHAAGAAPDLHRSEAFVEDLFDSSSFAPERTRQAADAGSRWHTVALCVVPLLVALLGGALAFFHGAG
jgi:hypothetical protein